MNDDGVGWVLCLPANDNQPTGKEKKGERHNENDNWGAKPDPEAEPKDGV